MAKFLRVGRESSYVTCHEPLGRGDGKTRRFKLPDGALDSQGVTLYVAGGKVAADAKIPETDTDGTKMVEMKDGIKVVIYREVGWKFSQEKDGLWVIFDEVVPAGPAVTCSRILEEIDPRVKARIFQFPMLTRDFALKFATSQPSELRDFRTQKEIDEEAKVAAEKWEKATLEDRALIYEHRVAEDRAKSDAQKPAVVRWLLACFEQMTGWWNIFDADGNQVPFSKEAFRDYCMGSEDEDAATKTDVQDMAVELGLWLMGRASDVQPHQQDRARALAKN